MVNFFLNQSSMVKIEIKSCKDCPHFEQRRLYTGDSFEHVNDWFCTKEGGNQKIKTLKNY